MRRVHQDVGAGFDRRDGVLDAGGVGHAANAQALGLVDDDGQGRRPRAAPGVTRITALMASTPEATASRTKARTSSSGMAGAAAVGRKPGRAVSVRAGSPPRPPPPRPPGAGRRKLGKGGNDDARAVQLPFVNAPLQLYLARRRAAGRLNCREARFQKLAHAVGSLGLQPLIGRTPDDVPVGIDEAGHQSPALGVDLDRAVGDGGVACADRHDPAILDDDTSVGNDASVSIDDPGVGDDQILGGEIQRTADNTGTHTSERQ